MTYYVLITGPHDSAFIGPHTEFLDAVHTATSPDLDQRVFTTSILTSEEKLANEKEFGTIPLYRNLEKDLA